MSGKKTRMLDTLAKVFQAMRSRTTCWQAGVQPTLHLGGDVWGEISFGGKFHEISFDDVIVLIQLWYNFFANGHV